MSTIVAIIIMKLSKLSESYRPWQLCRSVCLQRQSHGDSFYVIITVDFNFLARG